MAETRRLRPAQSSHWLVDVDDHSPGRLVVPGLLAVVEGRPDEAQQANQDAGAEGLEVVDDRPDRGRAAIDWTTIDGPHDSDADGALPEGCAALPPQEGTIPKADERSCEDSDNRDDAHEQDRAQDQPVEEGGRKPDPEPGVAGRIAVANRRLAIWLAVWLAVWRRIARRGRWRPAGLRLRWRPGTWSAGRRLTRVLWVV